MINYKENIIHTHSNEISSIRMFVCLHRYDQQLEISQWNKRQFQKGSLAS
jgi:hypothetical protein